MVYAPITKDMLKAFVESKTYAHADGSYARSLFGDVEVDFKNTGFTADGHELVTVNRLTQSVSIGKTIVNAVNLYNIAVGGEVIDDSDEFAAEITKEVVAEWNIPAKVKSTSLAVKVTNTVDEISGKPDLDIQLNARASSALGQMAHEWDSSESYAKLKAAYQTGLARLAARKEAEALAAAKAEEEAAAGTTA